MDRTPPPGSGRSRRLPPPPVRTPPPLRTKRVPGWQKEYQMEDLGCVTSARSRGVPADDEADDGDQVGEIEDPPDLVLSEDEDAGHGRGPGTAAEQPVVQTVHGPPPPYGGGGPCTVCTTGCSAAVPGPLPCPASSSSDSTRSGGSSISPT